jgi:hypothetical protein
MIEIKRLDGTTVLTLEEVPVGSLVHRELMADHYVKLPFTLAEPVYFQLGDYVELPSFGRFELTEPYSPKYNSATSGYDYTLQLDAYYMKWKNKKVRYMPQSAASETSFNLTAAVGVHLNVIINGINALGAKDSSYKFDGTTNFRWELKNFDADKVNTAKLKKYDNTDFITALNDLAEIFGCEWWVEDNTIYFGKCRIEGEEVEFELDESVEEMTSTQSEQEYATRIIAFGSDRNLPADYRKDASADITINGIAQKRLMLPLTGSHACPNGYLQDESITRETEAIEAIVIDESIYPRTRCVVGSVTTYTDTTEDEETGETITRTFYRLTDKSGFNFSTDYILEGQTLHILFQSGSMNGMDFECQYNDDEKYYEVVANEEYGRFLPDENLHPAVDDEFVLYGWDSTKIGDTGLIDAAEEELYQAVLAKFQEMKIDPNTYNCSMMSDWYSERMDEDNLVVYSLGQPVRLINPTFFASGRSSRIIGYEVKLDFIYDSPEYIVGEAAAYSRSKSMQEQIDAITYNGASYAGGNGGGSGVYIITTTSRTPASDSNVYSASRSDKMFLRRDKEDKAYGQITFEQGLLFKQLLKSYGAIHGFQDGVGIIMDALNGLIETDGLDVRGFMRVMELVINRLQLMESDYSFTEGDTTERVDFSDSGLRMVLTMHKEHDNDHTPFYPGDILYAKVNDLLDHGTYYTCWVKVISVDLTANTIKIAPYPALKQSGATYVPGAKNYTFLGTEIDGDDFDTEILQDYALYPDGYEKILNLTRHGNVADGLLDGDDPNSYSASVLAAQKERQQAWVLSTTDKRLSFFWNVDEPIVRDENYALCLGILPDLANLPSTRNPDMPSLYVNTIFYDNQHAANYPAKVIKEDRGQWSDNPTAVYNGTTVSEPYHFKTFTNVAWLTYRNSSAWASLTDEQLRQKMLLEWKVDLEISRVWHYGALWECLVDGTTAQPWFNSTDWQLISGGVFDLQITISRRFLRKRDFNNGAIGTTLAFVLGLGGEDITSIVVADNVEWTRHTTGADTDPALAAADTAWNQNYGYHKLEIPVRSSDLPSNFWTVQEVKFTCSINIDGLVEPVVYTITIH